jgi:hypothetical protein
VPDRCRGPGGGGVSAQLCAFASMSTAAPTPEKSLALPPMCSPPRLTGPGLGQEGPQKVAAPTAVALPLRPTFGQRGGKDRAAQFSGPRQVQKELLGKPVVAVRDSPQARAEKGRVHRQELGPVVVEATSLGVANVAEREREGCGTDDTSILHHYFIS